jgi:hypothetical protein
LGSAHRACLLLRASGKRRDCGVALRFLHEPAHRSSGDVVPLGDLRQAHAGTTVLDNLFAVHIESSATDLATLTTCSRHATADALYQKCPFHLAQHRDNAEECPSQRPDVSNASRSDTNWTPHESSSSRT